MSKFVFVGDPNDNFSGQNTVTVKGVKFVKNVPTSVPEEKMAFFERHTHFMTPEKASKLHSGDSEARAIADATADAPDFVNDAEALNKFTVKELRAMAKVNDVDLASGDTKADIIEKLIDELGEPDEVDEKTTE